MPAIMKGNGQINGLHYSSEPATYRARVTGLPVVIRLACIYYARSYWQQEEIA
jgi:hypothetical protein